jgi:hypothetical protein
LSFSGFKTRLAALALLMLAVAAFAACGAAQEGQQEPAEQPEQEQPAEQQPAETEQAEAEQTAQPEPTGDAAQGAGQQEQTEQQEQQPAGAPLTAAGEPAEVRDGVWTVGDGGEVEFAFENGSLAFVDARPNEGWQVEIDEQDSDEIEVDFRQGGVEWTIEIETDGNNAEIEIDQTIEPAEAGTYEIADAGVVEFTSDGSALALVDARANEGWNVVVDEQTPEEIEVEFARDNVDWDFDAELDDGVLDIEIDQEITGPIPN